MKVLKNQKVLFPVTVWSFTFSYIELFVLGMLYLLLGREERKTDCI